LCLFFFQAEDGIRDFHVTGVQTCALPICTWLGYGIGNLINVFNPDVVVIGGLYQELYPYLREPMEEAARSVVLQAPGEAVRIVRGSLGVDASLLGAAEMALSPVIGAPAGVRAVTPTEPPDRVEACRLRRRRRSCPALPCWRWRGSVPPAPGCPPGSTGRRAPPGSRIGWREGSRGSRSADRRAGRRRRGGRPRSGGRGGRSRGSPPPGGLRCLPAPPPGRPRSGSGPWTWPGRRPSRAPPT